MNMRTFEHFPEQDKCLLCGKNTDKPCILIGVDGTESCGNEEAKAVHVDCMWEHFRYRPDMGVIYRIVTVTPPDPALITGPASGCAQND